MAKKDTESKIDKLKARRAEDKNTDALRLKAALAKKQCRHCGQRSWDLYRTVGDTRYLKCRGCTRNDTITVPRLPDPNAKETPGEAEDGANGQEENDEASEAPEAPE